MSERSASRGIAFSSRSVETCRWKMPNRGTSGIVGGSEIAFRCDRRVVINLSVRLASFIYRDRPA